MIRCRLIWFRLIEDLAERLDLGLVIYLVAVEFCLQYIWLLGFDTLTHKGLRSHGHIRCLVISLPPNPLVRLPADTYRRIAFDVGAGSVGNRAVK
jgi:hypothetical protein